jgi:hypothetical protein
VSLPHAPQESTVGKSSKLDVRAVLKDGTRVNIELDGFHTSFHIREDDHRDYMLIDAIEMHYIDMAKLRRLMAPNGAREMHRESAKTKLLLK